MVQEVSSISIPMTTIKRLSISRMMVLLLEMAVSTERMVLGRFSVMYSRLRIWTQNSMVIMTPADFPASIIAFL